MKTLKPIETMKILIDNGHGEETAGKRSPDETLREYVWTRDVAKRLEAALKAKGYNAERIVPETKDISLNERCKRANTICRRYIGEHKILVSLHCNAAGSDGQWHTAHGWSAHVSNNASVKSKLLARCLIASAEDNGLTTRKYARQAPYWEQNLAICRDTICPAVLTENLFQDNREDVRFLLSEAGKNAIVKIHIEGIEQYFKEMK